MRPRDREASNDDVVFRHHFLMRAADLEDRSWWTATSGTGGKLPLAFRD
jgi:hypothetical protein